MRTDSFGTGVTVRVARKYYWTVDVLYLALPSMNRTLAVPHLLLISDWIRNLATPSYWLQDANSSFSMRAVDERLATSKIHVV